MPTLEGTLKPSEVQMTDEEWAINKSCALKKRDHKYHWKNDPTTGLPSDTIGVCAHCGHETELLNRNFTPDEK